MSCRNALRACLVFIAIAGAAATAAAHSHLEKSVPAADAAVAAASEIRLTFNEAVEPALSRVSVKSKSGEAVEAQKVAADPADKATLVLSIAKPLAPGTYSVDWRVVSADSHKMHGSFSFSVKP
jgi:methionine-rich copper-binding protein CopC